MTAAQPTGERELCIQALRAPEAAAATWRIEQWNRFVAQARSAGLLARGAGRIQQRVQARARQSAEAEPASGGPPGTLPDALLGHLDSSTRMFAAQRAEIRRELSHLRKALSGVDAPVVLLKGAGYLAAELPAGEARFFSDVDILVPKSALPDVESQLTLHGWLTTHHNEYDQRYYRQWMHELPPMQHVHRGTTLDVHHTIAPETGRLHPDPSHLFAASRALPGYPGLRVLSPHDMVLHSMTHLFLNDDMSHALRDLSDLDLLLRHFARIEPGFWEVLIERAQLLQLTRPLYYGLRYCHEILATPVPKEAIARMQEYGPSGAGRTLMDALWRRALVSPHPSAAPPARALALFALYVRGHWLRMPPALLVKHLAIKALRLHERGPAATDLNALRP